MSLAQTCHRKSHFITFLYGIMTVGRKVLNGVAQKLNSAKIFLKLYVILFFQSVFKNDVTNSQNVTFFSKGNWTQTKL